MLSSEDFYRNPGVSWAPPILKIYSPLITNNITYIVILAQFRWTIKWINYEQWHWTFGIKMNNDNERENTKMTPLYDHPGPPPPPQSSSVTETILSI